jgi:hypothetical protein
VDLVPLGEMLTETFLPSKAAVLIKPRRKARDHGLSVWYVRNALRHVVLAVVSMVLAV